MLAPQRLMWWWQLAQGVDVAIEVAILVAGLPIEVDTYRKHLSKVTTLLAKQSS